MRTINRRQALSLTLCSSLALAVSAPRAEAASAGAIDADVDATLREFTARLSAVDLVRRGAEALGGKGGGGRPDMAQAGGPDGSRAQAALEAIEAKLAS